MINKQKIKNQEKKSKTYATKKSILIYSKEILDRSQQTFKKNNKLDPLW